MTHLCEDFSRETGYKWLGRYRELRPVRRVPALRVLPDLRPRRAISGEFRHREIIL